MSVLLSATQAPLNPNPAKTYSPLWTSQTSFQKKLILNLGHIHGPFLAPPLHDFHCSPLGTATCQWNPKQCVFNHYSWPCSSSVNDKIPDSEGEIQYESFAYAVASLCKAGKGALLTKLDLKEIFHHIPIHSMDWNILGFSWCDKFYYPIVLMFGGKSAPY